MLLDDHEWVMQRGTDAGSTKEVARELLSADLSMRTRWMPSWKFNEFGSFPEVLQHHRGHSAYLFNNISKSRTSASFNVGRERSRSRRRNGGRSRDPERIDKQQKETSLRARTRSKRSPSTCRHGQDGTFAASSTQRRDAASVTSAVICTFAICQVAGRTTRGRTTTANEVVAA